jgi:transporter family protein
MWLLYAFLSALTAALVAIFAKAGLGRIDPTLATTLRSIVMAVFLVLFTIISGKFSGLKNGPVSLVEWLFLAGAGIAGALSWLFYFFALREGNVAPVVAVDRLSIVFVVLFAALFFKEVITWRTGLGILLMVSGALLISLRAEVMTHVYERILHLIGFVKRG